MARFYSLLTVLALVLVMFIGSYAQALGGLLRAAPETPAQMPQAPVRALHVQ